MVEGITIMYEFFCPNCKNRRVIYSEKEIKCVQCLCGHEMEVVDDKD